MTSLLPCTLNDPAFLKDWVEYQDSLIDKLKAATGNAELKRLSQAWVKPCWWEKQVLHITDPQICRREIVICDGGEVYWYARTLIPRVCYELDPAFFNRLEQEPLRNLIFNEPRIQKSSRISYCVDKRCIEFYWISDFLNTQESLVWVRITKLCFEAQESFYLIELLLPQLGNLS